MLGSKSYFSQTEANRQMIAEATAAYLARGAQAAQPEPAPAAEKPAVKPGPAPILFGCREERPRRQRKPVPPRERKASSAACRAKRDVHVERIAQLAEQQYGPTAIGREIGISRVTVLKIAAENGIKLRNQPTPTEFDASMSNGRARLIAEGVARRTAAAPRVRELAAAKMTRREIAASMGASVNYIERVAREHNIQIINRGQMPGEETTV